jgi:hypothetical protein
VRRRAGIHVAITATPKRTIVTTAIVAAQFGVTR